MDAAALLMVLFRTFAQEEPEITSVALRPGMVDTAVSNAQMPCL